MVSYATGRWRFKMSTSFKKICIATSIAIFSLGATFTGAAAWFISSVTISNVEGTGSAEGAYFAYGDGLTPETAYGIANTRHLNNLAWLQYNGNFDGRHFYFELANDINMDGSVYTIPPIGTEDHPFIGVFDGKGHTINNIKVTNNATSFTSKPTKITYNEEKAEIVGFFGVVGEVGEESYSSSTNALKNVTLNNLTVESQTTNTLIGLAAGYVNAEMDGVKVGTSKITVNGNSAKTGYSSNLSDYGLVGYTTKTGSSGSYQQKLSNYYDSSSTGDDPGWGGSIDFKSFYSRLDTIRKTYAATKQTMGYVYDDVYNEADERISHTPHSTKQYHVIYNEDYAATGKTWNEKIGALQANMNNTDLTRATLYYLAGGHYTVAKTRDYYDHEGFKIYKIVGGVTHYLGASSTTISDNLSIADKSGANESEALVWELFDGSSGKISTKYNNNNYYLAIAANGTDLVIRSSYANGTTFQKSVSEDGIRLYVNSGTYEDQEHTVHTLYDYLDYSNSNGWKMVKAPIITPYSEPAVTAPNPGTEEEYIAANGLNPSNYKGAYQITYMDGDTKRFVSVNGSNIETSTKPFDNGWNFGGGTSLPTSGSNTTIKSASGNNYLKHSNNSSPSYANGNSDSSWRATNNGGSWTFSYSVTSWFIFSTTYYLKRSGSNIYIEEDSDNNTFTLEETATSVSTYNSSLHDEWQTAKNLYDGQVEARDTYINETYPAIVTAYETQLGNHNTAFNSAYLPLLEISAEQGNVVSGPDYQDVDRPEDTGMDYEHDQDVTYLPLTVESDSNLEAKLTNTGYIMGGETYTSPSAGTDASNGNARIASFYTIADSLKNYNTTSKTFTKNSVYTVDSTGPRTINDDSNTYVKYKASKDAVESALSGSTKVYGLHFTQTGVSKDNLVTARYAAINGDIKRNYKMPANSIDFNLREQGYINFFAGTYGYSGSSDTTIDSFFSLHQIQRDGTEIVAINEIEEVYSDDTINHSYIYKLSNGNYTVPYSIDPYNSKKFYVLDTKNLITDTEHGGYTDGVYHQLSSGEFSESDYSSSFTKVFDMAWLKNYSYFTNLNSDAFHKAFYFEIPTNPGEYAMGTVTGKSYGAYLIYLDIGANAANQDKITAYAISTFQSGLNYPAGVDFDISSLEGTEGGETACIIIFAGEDSDGDVDFGVSGTTINYEGDFDTQYSYTATPLSGADPPAPASAPPTNGTRMIRTRIVSTDNTVWNIVTVEDLDSTGEPVDDTIQYVSIKHEDEQLTVDDLPESFDLIAIRKNVKTNIVTLTREAGTNTFDATATYSGTDFKEVAISLNATGITVAVSDRATGYTFTVEETPITTNGQTITIP